MVSGKVSGMVSGMVSGKVSGRVSGRVSGMVSGKVSGKVSGMVSGMVSGKVSGMVSDLQNSTRRNQLMHPCRTTIETNHMEIAEAKALLIPQSTLELLALTSAGYFIDNYQECCEILAAIELKRNGNASYMSDLNDVYGGCVFKDNLGAAEIMMNDVMREWVKYSMFEDDGITGDDLNTAANSVPDNYWEMR